MAAGDELAFLSGKRRVVYHELHGNGGLADFLERNGLYVVGRAEGISDVDIGNTGNGNDGTDAGFLNFYLI